MPVINVPTDDELAAMKKWLRTHPSDEIKRGPALGWCASPWEFRREKLSGPPLMLGNDLGLMLVVLRREFK
jgi:hypothetical protein